MTERRRGAFIDNPCAESLHGSSTDDTNLGPTKRLPVFQTANPLISQVRDLANAVSELLALRRTGNGEPETGDRNRREQETGNRQPESDAHHPPIGHPCRSAGTVATVGDYFAGAGIGAIGDWCRTAFGAIGPGVIGPPGGFGPPGAIRSRRPRSTRRLGIPGLPFPNGLPCGSLIECTLMPAPEPAPYVCGLFENTVSMSFSIRCAVSLRTSPGTRVRSVMM